MDDPELYLGTGSAAWKDGLKLLQELKGSVQWSRNERILDVGCGPGNFTEEVLLSYLPQDATVIGCDKSKCMIEYAKKTIKNERISFKEMDIEDKFLWNSWPKNYFNKIYSFYCFHWVGDWRTALKNIYLLLKEGGEIYMVFLAEHKGFSVFQEILKTNRWEQYINGKLYYPMYLSNNIEDRNSLLIDYLKNAGFKNIELSRRLEEALYPSMENYIDLMKTVDQYRKHIPSEMLQEYDESARESIEKTATIIPTTGESKIVYSNFILRAMK